MAETGRAQQCDPGWRHGFGIPGTDAEVLASVLWDPDGTGPSAPRLVVGGAYATAGDVLTGGVAVYDLETHGWTALGGGIPGTVRSLAILPNGDLIAAGTFYSAGDVDANSIARWNGSSWSPMGNGLSKPGPYPPMVNGLAVTPNGDVIAAGNFTGSGSVRLNNIARWNGIEWSEIGPGISDVLYSVACLQNGDIIAGLATFSKGLSRWNGSEWSTFEGGLNGPVNVLRVLDSGELIVGGSFSTAGGLPIAGLARWDGTSWHGFGSGLGLAVKAISIFPNGDLIVGGDKPSRGGIARWDGVRWTDLTPSSNGAKFGSIFTITVIPSGDFMAGGIFYEIQRTPANHIVRSNGTDWLRLSEGINDGVWAINATSTGEMIIAGRFTTAGSVVANRVARLNGAAWSALGSGFVNIPFSIAVLPNDTPVVSGYISAINGNTVPGGIDLWNGSFWSSLVPHDTIGTVYCSLWIPSTGTLLVAGRITSIDGVTIKGGLAAWDGSSWKSLGEGPPSNIEVRAMVALRNGDIVAAGTRGISLWNGVSWRVLASDLYLDIYSLCVRPNNDLFVGGHFNDVGGVAAKNVARWDGLNWFALDSGITTGDDSAEVLDLCALKDGRVVAAGLFSTASRRNAKNIAIWDGTEWSQLGGGLNGGAVALYKLNEYEIAVGGGFTTAGNVASQYLARYAFACPADFNCDTFVTADDFDGFVNAFISGEKPADLNHDGFVTGDDYDLFVDEFIAGC